MFPNQGFGGMQTQQSSTWGIQNQFGQFGLRAKKSAVQYSWRITKIKFAGDGFARDAIGVNDKPAHEFIIGKLFSVSFELIATTDLYFRNKQIH